MLNLLHIENIAVIERADIEFHSGLNVLTGETGAGKSIVVDSISAVLGERASRDLLRTGTSEALVSASFSSVPKLNWFEENGITEEENGGVTIMRKMTADGKNFCRVNGVPVSLSQLRSLGKHLINIHGQHDSLQLTDESYQLKCIDEFGKNEDLRKNYAEKFDNMNSLYKHIRELTIDEAAKERKADMLRFQINELEKAELVPDEDKKLNDRAKELRNFGKISDSFNSAKNALNGGYEFKGAADLIYEAMDAIESIASINEDYSRLVSQINEAKCIIDDCAREVADISDSLEFSPEEQDEVESRLDLLHRLGKKYGPGVNDMLSFLENCKRELGMIEDSSEELSELEKKYAKAHEETIKSAHLLTENRKKISLVFKEKLLNELNDLNMGKLNFDVEFQKKELDASGEDSIKFLMSANAGEALKPINKIASGGEISRIMLALKNVLTEQENFTTMIFDEVDAGVSGRAALKVACKLASISRDKQVFCVTHLPQIAAMADTHFSVEKSEKEGRTFTYIRLLDRTGRKEELARISGGTEPTKAMLDSAEELIKYAEEYKSGCLT